MIDPASAMLMENALGGGQMPSINSAARSNATASSTTHFQTGDFNVGMGAGSDGFVGLIIVGAVFVAYLFIANKK